MVVSIPSCFHGCRSLQRYLSIGSTENTNNETVHSKVHKRFHVFYPYPLICTVARECQHCEKVSAELSALIKTLLPDARLSAIHSRTIDQMMWNPSKLKLLLFSKERKQSDSYDRRTPLLKENWMEDGRLLEVRRPS